MKIICKILLLLVLFILPLNKVAASSNLVVNCPSGGKVGTVIECELLGNSESEISAVKTNLSVSNNLEFVSFKTDSSWQGDGTNGEISLYTYPNQIGSLKLGIVTVRIKENSTSRTGTLYFNDVYFYKADFSKFAGTSISKNIKILSENNNLASLSLVGYDISPAFNKDVLEYSATVDSDIVVIEASLEDESAAISGTGRQTLNYGVNNFSVVVTSETGVNKEYKLAITRPEPPAVEDEPKEDESLDEEVDDKQDEGKIEEGVNDDQNALAGNKDEEQVEQTKDSNIKLQSLTIAGYEIEFYENVFQYHIEVLSDVTELVINAVPSSSKASVAIDGNNNFVVGANEVIITVTAGDGSKSIYTISVNKKSDVCAVNAINILNYDFNFDCNKYSYELEIGIEDSLNIEVIPSSGEAKVNIYNNANLKHEDVINIVVNLDGIDYKYNIKILKNSFEIENIVNSKQLIFLVVVIIFTLLYLTGRFLIKRRKKKIANKENS